MERVLAIVDEYQWWIYGVLGLVLIFYLRRAILARRESARSIFSLEQEQARARYNRSVAVSAVILVVVMAAFGLSNPLLPAPRETPLPTSTPTTGPLARPTLTATPPAPTITPTARPTNTPPTRPARVSPTPVVAATPTPVVRAPACPNPNARITSPGANQVLRGATAVNGTANIEGFQYYKVEFAPGSTPADGQWSVLGDLHRQPVAGGTLIQFNANSLPPGTYTLRLVVVDQTGNYPEPCRVTVVIQP